MPTPRPTLMPTVVGVSDDRVPWIELDWFNMVLDGVDIPARVSKAWTGATVNPESQADPL